MKRIQKALSLVVCTAMVVVQLGCATVVGGSRQEVAVNSTPSGATVVSNRGGMSATMEYATPTTIALERGGTYILTFKKQGYNSQQVELTRSMRGWILFWDILLFPVGIVVDAITGAWYRQEPTQVSVTLEKTSADIPGPDRIEIALSSQPQDGEVKIESPETVSVSVSTKE